MFREASALRLENVELQSLGAVASDLLKRSERARVWLFYGDMGAGKTTLIKEICRHLGVIDPMSSPTFSIVNEYLTDSGEKVFHFDFFRLKGVEEAYDIGTEDYFFSGSYCFVEWPEKVLSLVPDKFVEIRISATSPIFRTIELSVHDGEETNRI